jgi:4-hydroxybenzoate polyprenyltransferase
MCKQQKQHCSWSKRIVKEYITIIRPSHWTKNVFVFSALIFGGKLFGPGHEVFISVMTSIAAFFSFCLVSSSVYICNDILDRKVDANHPWKCNRPIASGIISVKSALVQSFIMLILSLCLGYFINKVFVLILVLYFVIMSLYSIWLKYLMIIDVMIISIGFVLRAISGAVVLGVEISSWLIICTFALCMFLGFGKRRSEIALLTDNAHEFRRNLSDYNLELLGHMLDVTGGLAIICFLLYATDARTTQVFGTNNLVYTTPLVLYCIFRFSALIQKGQYSGPVQIILKDLQFQLGLALWCVCCVLIIYISKLNSAVVV